MANERYKINESGQLEMLPALQIQGAHPFFMGKIKEAQNAYNAKAKDYPYTSLMDAINALNAKNKSATSKPVEVKPVYSTPENFQEALANYSLAFSASIVNGVENISDASKKQLAQFAKQVRDFDTKDLGAGGKQIIQNIIDVEDAINAYKTQSDIVTAQTERAKSGDQAQKNRLATEQDALLRLKNAANQTAPRILESFSRLGFEDIATPIRQATSAASTKLQTGLGALSSGNVMQTGGLAGMLNINVTDEQILGDINTARRNQYKSLYDAGTAAATDIQSQLDAANQFLSYLPASDQRRKSTQKTIDSLKSELSTIQKDTLQAKNFYDNYQPLSGTEASTAISKFRQSLQLPEERTLQQIRQIDPTSYETIQNVQKQYASLAAQPLPATTSPETEALRRDVEQRIGAQVALGSQLGAEEQRQYQQAARAAQTARGNIFGVAPAVEEAVTTGAAGEQRLAARLGAAQGFLSSGQTMSDALARDVALRNSLQQSRLGAAADFTAGGPTAYNLANQRMMQQQGLLSNYLAAAQPGQTGGFQATPSANIPYAYVNPMAGFQGAQNASSIYNTLADYQARTYSAQVGAIASQPSGAQNFANIAGGVGGLLGKVAPFGLICWVAREVYGNDNPKWLQFREWMLTKASDNLRNFYIKNGEKIAESIRNKPIIKAIIRKWMDGKIIELNGAI